MSITKLNLKESESWTSGFIGVLMLFKKAFGHDDSLISEEGQDILSVKGNKEKIDTEISKAKKAGKDNADVTLVNGEKIRITL